MTGDERWWSAVQVADHLGITASTWRAYVARRQAPGYDRRDPATGRPQWARHTIAGWRDSRPGPGARTDLRGTPS